MTAHKKRAREIAQAVWDSNEFYPDMGDFENALGFAIAEAHAAGRREALAEVMPVIELIQGQCGIPDAGDACRAILKTTGALKEKLQNG